MDGEDDILRKGSKMGNAVDENNRRKIVRALELLFEEIVVFLEVVVRYFGSLSAFRCRATNGRHGTNPRLTKGKELDRVCASTKGEVCKTRWKKKLRLHSLLLKASTALRAASRTFAHLNAKGRKFN